MTNNALKHFQSRAGERLNMPFGVSKKIWRGLPDLIARYDACDPRAMEIVDFIRFEREAKVRRWFSVSLPDWPRFAVLISPDGTPVTCMTMEMLKLYAPSKGAKMRQERSGIMKVKNRAVKLPTHNKP